MKRILISVIVLLFSSILFAEGNNEFSSFSSLGKMPLREVQTLNQLNSTTYEVDIDKNPHYIVPYLIMSFFANFTFQDDAWNQSEYTKKFIKDTF